MGGGMPYHLEKGVTLRLVEQHLNGDRRKMSDTLKRVRDEQWSAQQWVKDTLSGLWDDPGFQVRESSWTHLLRDWFGLVQDDRGEWQRPEESKTPWTGYWIGYHGEVEQIVREAFVWALELALGLERGADPATREDAGPPDAIELFWTCASPWFEAWVMRRPTDLRPHHGEEPPPDDTEREPGLVTIHFHTPSHAGATVSLTPVAKSTSALGEDPSSHPVPSLEIDYEQLDVPWDHAKTVGGERPRVPAERRRHATWVVTHANHVPTEEVSSAANTTVPTGFGDWDIPRLRTYRGTGGVVVVSPSLRAGGVTHHGMVLYEQSERFGPVTGAAPTGAEA